MASLSFSKVSRKKGGRCAIVVVGDRRSEADDERIRLEGGDKARDRTTKISSLIPVELIVGRDAHGAISELKKLICFCWVGCGTLACMAESRAKCLRGLYGDGAQSAKVVT